MGYYRVVDEQGDVFEIDTDEGKWTTEDGGTYTLKHWSFGDVVTEEELADGYMSWPDTDQPVLGKFMYIAGVGAEPWYVTDSIVSIEEVER